MEYIVEMLNIRKQFPGVLANDNVTVQLKQGEILALLGENGAGKSTLMSILFGLYHLDKGQIKVRGKNVKIGNPNDANALGIGMVHQHFQLVETFTVTENIIMGFEDGFVLNRKEAGKRIKDLSVQYGLNINPNAKIEDISVGMQQRVEILKMLYRNAEVLIFDEPTAVLTPQEIHELVQIMRNLIKEGKSIILITHKLKEIKEIADRCTVIRRGKLIGTVDVATTSTQQMADMMVGREVSFTVDKDEANPGDVVLSIDDLSVLNNRKTLGLKNFTLNVKRGEIMGVAGVEGNGQTELVEAITGLRKVESGSVSILGRDIAKDSIRKRNEAGIAHIPEDRQKFGLVLEYNLAENFVLKSYYQEPYSKNGLLKDDVINKHAVKIIDDFDVRAGRGERSPAYALSGGNQQKAILGREIDLDTDLLIAVQPTRGLDVGAIEYIHKRLVEQRDSGKAVLLVSLELDEILDLSDRIAVVNGGELIDLVINDDSVDENDIGLMMAGVKRGEQQ
jgi:simple sugar transport system ATP-binding protein